MCIKTTTAAFIAAMLTITCMAAEVQTIKTRNLLASVLIAEAGIDGTRGMIAVAEVIRNRASASKLSYRDVVLKPYWFSSMNNRSEWGIVHKHSRDPRLASALKIADSLLLNKLGNSVKGATHFDRRVPSWAAGVKPVAIVGRHKFWKLT